MLNIQKCCFVAYSMEFLGHTLDATGAKPLADEVDAVKTMPPPSTIEQLQAFLGMIIFIDVFCPASLAGWCHPCGLVPEDVAGL
jgi:hypothetical protein